LQKLKIIPADIDPNPINLVSSSSSISSKRVKLEPQSESVNPPNVQRTFVDRPVSPSIKLEPQSSALNGPLDFQHTAASPAGLAIRQREPQNAVVEPPDHSHAVLSPPAFIRRGTGETYPNAQIHNPLPLLHRAPAGPTPSSRHAAASGSNRPSTSTTLIRARMEAAKEERRKRAALDDPDA
jgi:hypothetical protein